MFNMLKHTLQNTLLCLRGRENETRMTQTLKPSITKSSYVEHKRTKLVITIIGCLVVCRNIGRYQVTAYRPPRKFFPEYRRPSNNSQTLSECSQITPHAKWTAATNEKTRNDSIDCLPLTYLLPVICSKVTTSQIEIKLRKFVRQV